MNWKWRLLFMAAFLPSLPATGQMGKAVAKTFSQSDIGIMATAMMDGDLCRRIVTDKAIFALTHKDARDPWADADNYDVDAAAFLQVKKTMLRVQSVATKKTAMALWIQIPGRPAVSHVVIRLLPGLSAFYNGEMTQPTPAPLSTVFSSGVQEEFQDKTGMQIVLAPVKDSLGHVAAVIEVVTQSDASDETNQHKDY